MGSEPPPAHGLAAAKPVVDPLRQKLPALGDHDQPGAAKAEPPPPSGRELGRVEFDDDLELGAPIPESTRGLGAPSSPAVNSGIGVASDELDAWEQDDLGGALELADDVPLQPSDPPASRRGAKPSTSVGVACVAQETPFEAPTLAQDSQSVTPESRGAGDAAEVRALAAYGDPPSSVLAAPAYAWRVFQRRRKLRELQQLAESKHGDVERRAKQQLMHVVQTLMKAEAPELREILGALVQADSLVADRSAQMDATRDHFAAQVAHFHAEVGERQQEKKELEVERKAALIHVEDCVHRQSAVREKVRQLDMRLGTLHDQAREAAGKGAAYAPPEFAAKIAAADAQKQRLDIELQDRNNEVKQAKEDLALRDRAIREIDRRVEAHHEQRRRVERQGDEVRTMRAQGVRAAEDQRLDAYELALRTVLREQPSFVDLSTQQTVAALDQERGRSRADVERHGLAVDAYDDDAYRRGLIGAVVLVALTLVLFGIAVSL